MPIAPSRAEPSTDRRARRQRRPNAAPRRARLSPLAQAMALALIAAGAQAGPGGERVVAGQASVSRTGSTTLITQASERAAIDWQRFDIGAGETVRFAQPGSASIALNRVLGREPSEILGRLQANGQVFLVNPHGVLFGRGAQVDVGGLVASTLDLGTDDFLAGRYRFSLDPATTAGEVVNRGAIAAAGGTVALIGPAVRNEGTLMAPGGSVALAAGRSVTVNLSGNRLLGLTVEQGALDALADNRGLIRADGGQAILTARAAEQLIRSAVNNTGVVEARSLVEAGGVIRLEGGQVTSTGELRAEGGRALDGGRIEVEGVFVGLGGSVGTDGARGGRITVHSTGNLSLADAISARGLAGAGGHIEHQADGRVTENSGSRQDASGATAGGRIGLTAGGGLLSSGHYIAVGAAGDGGHVDLSGVSVRLLSAQIDASGTTRGGRVRLGGAFMGGKPVDAAAEARRSFVGRWGDETPIASSERSFVNDSTRIDVSSSRGEGGTAILWSRRETTMLGAIDARGGGGGGSVEISAAETLRHASLGGVVLGAGGQLLLDPRNIVIGSAEAASNWSLQAVLGSGYSFSNGVLERGDGFGSAVALNGAGDRLAVGTPYDAGATNTNPVSGAVYLFTFTNNGFGGGTLAATIGSGYTGGKNIDLPLDGGDAFTGDQFGRGVSLNASGNRLAVGAPLDGGVNNGLVRSGAVHLFTFTDNSFSGGLRVATIGAGYTGGKNLDVALREEGRFGQSVSLNAAGDRLAVGAHTEDGDPKRLQTGAVRLFTFTDTSFSGAALAATLGAGQNGGRNLDLPLENNDFFGYSVALNGSGDRLAAGSPGAASGANPVGDRYGTVRLFTFTDRSFNGGALAATLGDGYSGGRNINVPLADGSNFGSGVSLNSAGNRLAVGAYLDPGARANSRSTGAVRLFTFGDNSFNGGVFVGTLGLDYSGPKSLALPLDDIFYFGQSVSLNAAGDRLAVGFDGGQGANNATLSSGGVQLFAFNDTSFGGAALAGTLRAGYAGDKSLDVAVPQATNFGAALALNAAGNVMAVGAPLDDGADGTATDAGAVHLFSFSDLRFGGATLASTIGAGYTGGRNLNVPIDAGDRFGSAVALNAAGDRLAVGAPGDDGAGNRQFGLGAVHLFSFGDSRLGGGTLVGTLGFGYTGAGSIDVPIRPGRDSSFGSAVALNAAGDRLAVGMPLSSGADGNNPNSGQVKLFTFSDGQFGGGTLAATLGAGFSGGRNVGVALSPFEHFGSAVSLNAAGNRLAVGTPQDSGANDAATASGAVQLFTFTDNQFNGGALAGTLGVGYTGGKNVSLTLGLAHWFGSSVSLSAAGDRLAVGVPYDSGAADQALGLGAVKIFSFTDTGFGGGTLVSTLGAGYSGGRNLDLPLDSSDFFGSAVAFNATAKLLVAGAPGDDGPGNRTDFGGAVRLISFSDDRFNDPTLQGTVGRNYQAPKNLNVALDSQDQFGHSVALNAAGDRLAVGARIDSGAANDRFAAGAVHLFSFSDNRFSGASLQGTIGAGYRGGRNVDLPLRSNDLFGSSVALNAEGNRLAVGARDDSGVGNATPGAGAVYLFNFFDRNFSGGTLMATLGAGYSGGRNLDVPLDVGDRFGSAVALDALGTRLAVGAPSDRGSGNTQLAAGAVRLFTFSDGFYSGGRLSATIGAGYVGGDNLDLALDNGDRFGSAVALNAAGTRLAVGAPGDAGVANGKSAAGAVHLFRLDTPGFRSPSLAATLGAGVVGGRNIDVALDPGDAFGSAVALNATGDRLAVGAPSDGGAGNANPLSGAVRQFQFADLSYTDGRLISTFGSGYRGTGDLDIALDRGDRFGTSVALSASGERMAVGAPEDRGAANSLPAAGAVYLFANDVPPTPAASSLAYGERSAETLTLALAELQATLSQGTAVRLQASNDITLNAVLEVDNPIGSGGALTLQAGRSLLLNQSLRTDNGGLTLIANDMLANGVVNSERFFGNASITMAAGTTIDAGSGAVTIELRDGAGKSFRNSGAISLGSINAASIQVLQQGPSPASDIVIQGGARLAASGSGTALELAATSGGRIVNNAGADALATPSGRWLMWSTNPANDVRGELAYSFRQYNARFGETAPALAGGNGMLYSLAPVLTAQLTGTVSKIYDGTTRAPVTTANFILSGMLDGDEIGVSGSGRFDDRHVGVGKSVTVTGLTALGSVTENGRPAVVYGYSVSADTLSGAIGSIAQRPITVTARADSKTYDGNTASAVAPLITAGSLVAGVGDTAAFAQVFDNRNVGNGKTLRPTGRVADGNSGLNYAVTFERVALGTIDPRPITVSAVADSKTYDGGTASAAVPRITLGSLAGGGDRAAISQNFDSRDAGTGKTLTPTGTINDGNGGANYTISFVPAASGVITPRALTITAAADTKTYDGSTASAALPVITLGALAPIGDDRISLSQQFDDRNTGTAKTLTPTGSVSDGNGGANYTITFTPAATGEITPRAITVTATADRRTYDGSTASAALPVITLGSLAPVGGDSAAFTQGFDNRNAGTAKTLTPAGSINDGNGGTNYAIKFAPVATGEITPRPITVTAAADTKVYDGSTASAALPVITLGSLAPVGGDSVAFTQSFDDRNAGTAKTLTPAGLVSDGHGGANYTVSFVPAATGEITPRPITVTAAADTKVYDGSTASAALPVITLGSLAPVGGDSAAFTQSFDNRNAGTAKTLTPAGLIGDGNGGANYAISFTPAATGEITPRPITVTAAADTKVYDGSTASAALPVITLGSLAPIGGDSAAFTQSFDDRNAGTAKTLTPAGTVSDGNGGANYTIAFVPAATGTIDRAVIRRVTGIAAADKVYDAGTAASLDTSAAGFEGRIGDDRLAVSGARGAFADANAGAARPVAITGLALAGADAGNYTLADTTAQATAAITPRPLTLTTLDDSKVYGQPDPAWRTVIGGAGLAGGDTAAGVLNGAASRSAGEGVAGSPYEIGQGSLAVNGNYTIAGFTPGRFTIVPRPLAITADDRLKLTGAPLPAFGARYDGLATGDTAASLLGTLVFTTPADALSPPGSYPVTPSGLQSANYSIRYLDGLLSIVNPPPPGADTQGAVVSALGTGTVPAGPAAPTRGAGGVDGRTGLGGFASFASAVGIGELDLPPTAAGLPPTAPGDGDGNPMLRERSAPPAASGGGVLIRVQGPGVKLPPGLQ